MHTQHTLWFLYLCFPIAPRLEPCVLFCSARPDSSFPRTIDLLSYHQHPNTHACTQLRTAAHSCAQLHKKSPKYNTHRCTQFDHYYCMFKVTLKHVVQKHIHLYIYCRCEFRPFLSLHHHRPPQLFPRWQTQTLSMCVCVRVLWVSFSRQLCAESHPWFSATLAGMLLLSGIITLPPLHVQQ